MNLPNIVYLVAFDRNIVAKALEGLQHGGRERFLDKIVGAYYFLPKTALWKDVDDYFSSFQEWKEWTGNKGGFARAIAEVLGTHREFNKIRLQLGGRLFLEDKDVRLKFFLEECLRELSHETYQHFITLSEKDKDALIGLTNEKLLPGLAGSEDIDSDKVKGRAEAFLKDCRFKHDKENIAGFIEALGHLNSGVIEEIDEGLIGWGSSVSEAIRVWIVLRLLRALQPDNPLKKELLDDRKDGEATTGTSRNIAAEGLRSNRLSTSPSAPAGTSKTNHKNGLISVLERLPFDDTTDD